MVYDPSQERSDELRELPPFHLPELPVQVIDINTARRKRDEHEELRLEQKVIERWTGKDEDDAQ